MQKVMRGPMHMHKVRFVLMHASEHRHAPVFARVGFDGVLPLLDLLSRVVPVLRTAGGAETARKSGRAMRRGTGRE